MRTELYYYFYYYNYYYYSALNIMTVPCNNNVAFHSVHTELYYYFCYYYSYYYSELQCCLFKNCSLWRRLDIVCNNAAVLYEGDWNKTLNTNLVSFNCFLFSIAPFPLHSTDGIPISYALYYSPLQSVK